MQRIRLVEPVIMLATMVQWLFLATATGALVGLVASLFLHALYFLLESTATTPSWAYLLLLPVGGLLNGLLLHWERLANKTGLRDSAIAAVHSQSGELPFKTVLIKPLAALITLGSGGSAGKEGPCAHLGATVASGLGSVFRVNAELRKRLVACGISAGFASVFGTPIAGAIYGVEILTVGRIRHDFLFPAIIASVSAFKVSTWMQVPYEYYSAVFPEAFSQILFLKVIGIGVICGLVAWLFVYLVAFVRRLFANMQRRSNLWPPLMPFLGGIIVAILILFIPADYLSLSLPLIDQALAGDSMPYLGFLWKTLLVSVTLGSGFYGGIVTPQFVIGAITGNAFAAFLGVSPELGAAIGLVAVVAAASSAPVAAILMGVELFGHTTGTIYIAGAGVAAYLMIGHRSVYPDQLVAFSKTSWLYAKPGPQFYTVHLSYGLRRWLAHRRLRGRRKHDGD